MQKTGIRHNDLRDLTAILLSNVYKDVEIKLKMLLVTGEIFLNRTANTPLKQDLILDHGGSGLGVNKHFSIYGYLTHTLKVTLT